MPGIYHLGYYRPNDPPIEPVDAERTTPHLAPIIAGSGENDFHPTGDRILQRCVRIF